LPFLELGFGGWYALFPTEWGAAMDDFLRGERLYGDEFTQSQIDSWFADEAEGYFELANTGKPYVYAYAALNEWHGFSRLPKRRFRHVVSIGGAYGEELRPVVRASDRITILEPSDRFVTTELDRVPVRYVKPDPSGVMPFPDCSVDLITCFGVLHHIPNVSKVLCEFQRVLAPGGYALIREPITSMGDWRQPRPGLTKHERGIPIALFRKAIGNAGLGIAREKRCMFSLTPRLAFMARKPVYNSLPLTVFDSLICSMPWAGRYHATTRLQKFRPGSVFYVLEKC
jgi:SAM-dependent methyltransferase